MRILNHSVYSYHRDRRATKAPHSQLVPQFALNPTDRVDESRGRSRRSSARRYMPRRLPRPPRARRRLVAARRAGTPRAVSRPPPVALPLYLSSISSPRPTSCPSPRPSRRIARLRRRSRRSRACCHRPRWRARPPRARRRLVAACRASTPRARRPPPVALRSDTAVPVLLHCWRRRSRDRAASAAVVGPAVDERSLEPDAGPLLVRRVDPNSSHAPHHHAIHQSVLNLTAPHVHRYGVVAP